MPRTKRKQRSGRKSLTQRSEASMPLHHVNHSVPAKENLCEQCGEAFASKKSLSKHSLTHQDDRPKSQNVELNDEKVDDKTGDEERLQNSKPAKKKCNDSLVVSNGQTSNEKTFKCYFCEQVFTSKPKRNEHVKTVHPREKNAAFPEFVESKTFIDGRFSCSDCSFKTDSEASMLLHRVNHSVPAEMQFGESDEDNENDELNHNELESNDARQDSSDNEKLQKKKRNKHYKYKCPCCDKMLARYALKKHIYVHTSEKPYRCEDCGKEFTNIYYLRNHQKTHEGVKEAFCEQCGAAFASKKSLSKHSLIHQEDRPKSHLCETCGMGFYDKESLKAHTYRLHLPKEARRFKCDFENCRYTCLYQHQLTEHQKVHSDEKPWQCDLCDYTAKSKWTFKKHYRKHTKEKPFKCPHCDYASGLSSNLTRHLRIHTGSKPFKCPYCTYSCNNHENLRKHVLSTKKHQGLYLYNCSHCEYGTNVFSDLRKHFEVNHSDIYTIDEIDRMVSSIYHKHEDNTTVVPYSQNQDVSVDGDVEAVLIREATQLEGIQMSGPMIVIQQVQSNDDIVMEDVESNEEGEFIVPTITSSQLRYAIPQYREGATHEIQFANQSNLTIQNFTANANQNPSEVIIIDSNVLEAEEICVSEQHADKDNQIVIAFST